MKLGQHLRQTHRHSEKNSGCYNFRDDANRIFLPVNANCTAAVLSKKKAIKCKLSRETTKGDSKLSSLHRQTKTLLYQKKLLAWLYL
jgi:hypothetical protein